MTRVAVRMRDDDLATNRLRGIGYRAEVKDGWRGPVRRVRQDAVADMLARRAENVTAAPTGDAVSPTGAAEAS